MERVKTISSSQQGDLQIFPWLNPKFWHMRNWIIISLISFRPTKSFYFTKSQRCLCTFMFILSKRKTKNFNWKCLNSIKKFKKTCYPHISIFNRPVTVPLLANVLFKLENSKNFSLPRLSCQKQNCFLPNINLTGTKYLQDVHQWLLPFNERLVK